MNLQLIQGEFNANDAISILSQMIQVKLKYHENKISSTSNEEDIKYREEKIKRLQNELSEIRNNILTNKGTVKIDAVINIE